MKKLKLNLKGVKALSKKEQQSINGGRVQECTFTYVNAITGEPGSVTSGGYSDGQAGSDEANAACVDMIINGTASSCGYDCEWDD